MRRCGRTGRRFMTVIPFKRRVQPSLPRLPRLPRVRFSLSAVAWMVLVFAAVLMTLAGIAPPGVAASPSQPAAAAETSNVLIGVRVIDGDTVASDGVRYRIANIDTPEMAATCDAERVAAQRATNRAVALISAARRIEMRPTGRVDRFGRTVAFISVDGADFGSRMIAAGLARPWRGRREPWCDAGGHLIP